MSSSETVALIIPARYGSTRLLGKPLLDLLGKPMVRWVYEAALRVSIADRVVVATDDQRIADVVNGFGGEVVLTSVEHLTGTDRLVEVAGAFDADVYVNVQGDEPLIRPEDIELLVRQMLSDSSIEVGTLYHSISSEEAKNPNTVKIALNSTSDALFFSRSAIPFPRDSSKHPGFKKHVGVYAYRRHILNQYASLPESLLEQTEQLEQLRLLSAGVRVKAFEVAPTGPGVDTPACLDKVRAIMSGKPHLDNPRLEEVKLLITDVDGVLTDGGIYYDASGESVKRFHVRDGLGIRMLEESGIGVAVLSGRDSAALRKRVSDLGVSLYAFGVKDKAQGCIDLMLKAGVSAEQTVCIGDDSIDLPAFKVCGQSYAVADAPSYVKDKASGVLSLAGGHGALRELADQILIAQGRRDVLDSAEGFLAISENTAQ